MKIGVISVNKCSGFLHLFSSVTLVFVSNYIISVINVEMLLKVDIYHIYIEVLYTYTPILCKPLV